MASSYKLRSIHTAGNMVTIQILCCRIHFGGVLGGVAAAVIILIQYGISGVFKGRKTKAARG